MKRLFQSVALATITLLAISASAQGRDGNRRGSWSRAGDAAQQQQQQQNQQNDKQQQPQPPQQQRPQSPQDNSDNRGKGSRRGPGPHAGDWLRRFSNVPPAEQQKQLEQDPKFKELSPNRQQRLRDQLDHFNNLPPDRRQRILNRMEVWEHMTPDQQNKARGLYGQFRSMPPDRRKAVTQTLRRLREMSPQERQQEFNSDDFRKSFSDQEQNLIKGLSDLRGSEDGGGGE